MARRGVYWQPAAARFPARHRNRDADPVEPVPALLDSLARFEPETISSMGSAGHEDDVAYLELDAHAKQLAALAEASDRIGAALAKETDRGRRQDLEIVARAAKRYTRAEEFNERRLLPSRDLIRTIYLGLAVLDAGLLPPDLLREAVLDALRKR